MENIDPVETLNYSVSNIIRAFLLSLIVGTIAWLIIQLFFPLMGWNESGILLFLILSQLIVVVFEMAGPDIQNRRVPNQGIWQSRKNAICFALLGSVWVGAAAFITQKKLFLAMISLFSPISVRAQPFSLSTNDTVTIVLSGCLLGLFFGLTQAGTACIQHFVLRFVLYCKGDIPWNYARFLNYATERMFLQRVGGRYIFIHRLLQEYFAEPECSKKEL